jgi:transposase InsO family protein
MPDDKSLDIALFKYGIIAKIINETGKGQRKYFKKMSKKEFEVPHLGKKRFKPDTFKSWLRQYRNAGFDALRPKIRTDKGSSRKIDGHLKDSIDHMIQDYPFLSPAGIYRLLISGGEMEPEFVSEGTLRKYIKDNKLLTKNIETIPRKKFEKEHINELWISDCMHGPYIIHDNKKRRIYLISIIDDCSRVIVGARFFLHESSFNLQILIKEALLSFGVPDVLYTDNGSIFVTANLQLACARLGIALVHSKPYDSPSRGKKERWYRTIRQKFLPLVDLSQIECIEDINMHFLRWLDKEYQKSYHHGINTRPMDKWMDDIKHTKIKRVSAQELDLAFLITINRRVKNDSTISVNSILYEVPPSFIGKTIQIRYPLDKPENLTIYENNKPVCRIKRVNPHENSSPPSWGIRFTKKGHKDV